MTRHSQCVKENRHGREFERPRIIRQFVTGDGHCSPGLHAALGLEYGFRHIRQRHGLPRIPPAPLTPPPREDVAFAPEHIPQHLLPDWHSEHLARFTDKVKPRLLRRAAAARLAQLCVGGKPDNAARHLGIPRHAAKNALDVVERLLPPRRKREFDNAVDTLADHLNNARNRINYGRRRDALVGWSLTTHEWADMTDDLARRTAQRTNNLWPASPFCDWGEPKRILASVWIWVHITQGEHIFAPAVRADLDQPRIGEPSKRSIFSRWAEISTDHPRR